MRHRNMLGGSVRGAILGIVALLVLAPAASAHDPNAGGAAISDILILGVGMNVVLVTFLTPIGLYRIGKFPALGRLADAAGRALKLPGWVAMPVLGLSAALLLAGFGVYWDIATHYEHGRDAGILGNAAHYPLLFGFLGIIISGALGMGLATEGSPTAVRLPILGWQSPIGALLLFFGGIFALTAFPIDDTWHRFFGQDGTLWSPTHLMLITGPTLSILGAAALLGEARAAIGDRLPKRVVALQILACGGFLVGLSTYRAEFDIGLPQWPLIGQPVLIAFAGAVGFTFARLWIGRGGALGILAFYLAVRSASTVVVGPVMGHTTYHFTLYLAEALLVEAAGLALARRGSLASQPVTFGLVAGGLIGTVGVVAEWGWTHVWAEFPWPASLLGEAGLAALAVALAGGVLGAALGHALTPGRPRTEHLPRFALPAAAVVTIGALAFVVPTSAGDGSVRAAVSLSDVSPAPNRTVDATIRIEPRDAADNAKWLTVTADNGGGLIVDHLKKVGQGVYRTTTPIPVYGKWKTDLRLHRGREIIGVPLYLPKDDAIPAAEVPAPRQFTRAFIQDKKILIREAKDGVLPIVAILGYVLMLSLTASLIATIVWGIARVASRVSVDEPLATVSELPVPPPPGESPLPVSVSAMSALSTNEPRAPGR